MNRAATAATVLMAAAMAAGADMDYFHHSYSAAEKVAKKDGKALYLHFTTTWCGWCRRIENDVYKKDEGKKALSGFACAILDCTVPRGQQPSPTAKFNVDLMRKYGGRGYPFLVMVTTDGVLLHTIGGYKPLPAFKEEIAAAEGNFKKFRDFQAYAAKADKASYEYNAKAMDFYSATTAWSKAAEAAEALKKLDPQFKKGRAAQISYAMLRGAPASADDAARKALEEAVIKADPKNAEGFLEKALMGRASRLSRAARAGDAAAKAKAYTQAAAAMSQLLKQAEKLSDKANAYGFLGWLNLQAGRHDEAIASMEKAIELEGNTRRTAMFKRYLDQMKKAKAGS